MIRERETAAVRRKFDRNARWFDAGGGTADAPWRVRLIREARGRVLEIGVGTGKNLPFYDPAGTTELVGIDLSPGMLARARFKPCRVPVTLLEMDAQRLAFPDASFDTVLASYVFCSIPDPIAALREAARVCRPDGRILLLEHMRVDRPVIGALMDAAAPLVSALVGCRINRRTVENVRLAGLTVERVEPLKGDLVKLIYARP
ncbi:ubiquinone/menaquinone biosynthesis C-methylase UbiE [Symbiobacterium terraclitae]|jgi:ubiquinone/menaquinone biosynthesis C-methylase UbiE|uniref:Ubiquinone/menaquinone biosynthesis C-methylase UbiE n=1 Tax=Symbiobacterium terraclitae TaxID=557451 RepID=A0ABS4JUG6_9FIRM|nr:class I SAM-dependent methyltransferase [Symbiobacterium terraclitae]MBP2019207.1 ubiquinone/menaquinone biosynthesis C-methylase UbiE [Symbiobacterium terraclitae]